MGNKPGRNLGYTRYDIIRIGSAAMADPRHPERTRSYEAIVENGGRVLRGVHRVEGDDIVIITVHFDRGARP